MRNRSNKQSTLEKGKTVVILAVLTLALPTAYLVRATFDSYQKSELADNKELILSLAESDASAILRSGRKALMAHCKPFQKWTYPLLEPLTNAECIKESLTDTICIGGRPPNDVINPIEDPWREYEPKDHDPRNAETYAIAFNNIVLNSMANNSHCFIETTFNEKT